MTKREIRNYGRFKLIVNNFPMEVCRSSGRKKYDLRNGLLLDIFAKQYDLGVIEVDFDSIQKNYEGQAIEELLDA